MFTIPVIIAVIIIIIRMLITIIQELSLSDTRLPLFPGLYWRKDSPFTVEYGNKYARHNKDMYGGREGQKRLDDASKPRVDE